MFAINPRSMSHEYGMLNETRNHRSLLGSPPGRKRTAVTQELAMFRKLWPFHKLDIFPTHKVYSELWWWGRQLVSILNVFTDAFTQISLGATTATRHHSNDSDQA